MKFTHAVFASIAFFTVSHPVHAQLYDDEVERATYDRLPEDVYNDGAQDYISLSVGAFDALDDEGAIDMRAEYRPDITYMGFIKPWVGAEVTGDLSVWAGGGLLIDHEFSPRWYVTPSVGAGLYTKGSSDLDLDYPVQLRTQLEIAHEYDSGHRAGIAIGHLSNAGLGDNNPGTETVNLYWHIPY